MDQEKLISLLRAGYFPVDETFWLNIARPFRSEEERKKYGWARRNIYDPFDVQAYSEGYLERTPFEEIVTKAHGCDRIALKRYKPPEIKVDTFYFDDRETIKIRYVEIDGKRFYEEQCD